jgi:kynureninase
MNLEHWRDEFPILSRTTYLNSCSLGALSRRAMARMSVFQEEWSTYGASAWYEIWMGRLAELRARVEGLLNAPSGSVALEPSTSVALAAIASTQDYTRRNRVIVADLDFPTIGYGWMVRPDVEVVRVTSDDGVTVDPARYAEVVDERTAFIATSHVFFTTGAIQNAKAIADIAHAAGALFVLDGYQSAGQIPVDVQAIDADVFTTGPLKWLCGGPGVAYLYVRPSLLEQLRPTIAGWFGARDQFGFRIADFEFKDDARRFEMGTPALAAVHAALGAQEIIDEIGMTGIRERNSELTDRLIERASDAGLRLRLARNPEERSAIVMVEQADPRATVEFLAQNGMIVDYRPGYVRVSPHFYNTEAEVDRAVDLIARASGR